MKPIKFNIIYILIAFTIIILSGCGTKFSSMISESWSENYALATNGAKASTPEINDGDVNTMGVTKPPNRVYTIEFPEDKLVNRVVVYNQNVLAYQLFYWDKKADDWKIGYVMDTTSGKKQVYSNLNKLEIPQFDNRVKFITNKIMLKVTRADSDGIAMTRVPGKNDKILNQKVEYIGQGRNRMRVDIYQIYVYGSAGIREIEAYSQVEKPKS
jgi:hypothetical protein